MDNYVYETSFPSEIGLTKNVINEVLLFVDCRVPEFVHNVKNDLRLILQELLVNSVIHGNKNDISKYVYIRVEVIDGNISVKISDEGNGFDYAKLISEFDRHERLVFDHGRGIRLACSLADSFFFNSRGNEINICKRVANNEQSNGS